MSSVAIDIDDTLYSFKSLAREIIAQMVKETEDESRAAMLRRASYSPWTEWRSPADLLPDALIEVIDRCHSEEIIWQQPPFKGARDVLWRLIDSGHNIIYISNRKEEAHGPTAAWLEAHDFPSEISWASDREDLGSRVSLVCTPGAKTPHIADCQYIIDDRPKTLVEFVYDFDWKQRNQELRRLGFGLHAEHNGALTDIPGIYLAKTWSLLETYLEDKGVL